MRHTLIAYILLTTNSFSQITGNPNVNDLNAILLDSLTIEQLKGQWKIKSAEEFFKDKHRNITIYYWRINFNDADNFVANKCKDCIATKEGTWEIKNNKVIKITINHSNQESKYELEGDWVVYKLTDKDLTLIRVSTSTGDWKKFWYFERAN